MIIIIELAVFLVVNTLLAFMVRSFFIMVLKRWDARYGGLLLFPPLAIIGFGLVLIYSVLFISYFGLKSALGSSPLEWAGRQLEYYFSDRLK